MEGPALSEYSKSKGFSLVEVLLSVSILGLLLTFLTAGLIYGQESTALSGARIRATFLAQEGLEASRNIRDSSFANLTNGTYGLNTSTGHWAFSGSSDTTDSFTRTITISTVDANRKQVTSTVTWQQNPQRQGSVQLTTYLNNWKTGTSINSCTIYCQTIGTYTLGTCRQNSTQCTNNDEIYESGGNPYCTGGASANTCCCKP